MSIFLRIIELFFSEQDIPTVYHDFYEHNTVGISISQTGELHGFQFGTVEILNFQNLATTTK